MLIQWMRAVGMLCGHPLALSRAPTHAPSEGSVGLDTSMEFVLNLMHEFRIYPDMLVITLSG
jgi:hypothetical protein